METCLTGREKAVDALVVGAGPAGSIVSFLLQRSGLSTVILEQKPRLDEKICGGFVTNRGRQILSEIGIDLSDLFEKGSVPVYATDWNYRDHTKQYHYKDGQFGVGTCRKSLDNYLLCKADAEGADIRFQTSGKNIVIRDRSFCFDRFRSRHLVIAAGAAGFTCLSSVFSQRAVLPDIYERQSMGISQLIRCESAANSALPSNTVCFWFDNDTDYTWAIPIAANVWNVGYWSKSEKKRLKILFERGMKRYIEPQAGFYQILRSARGGICGNVDWKPYYEKYYSEVYGNNAWNSRFLHFCGDAAGNNNVETGEGLSFAFESAIRVYHDIVQDLGKSR